MNREDNGVPEDLPEQRMADVAAATRESLHGLEGEFTYLVEHLSSLAGYSIAAEAIR